MLGLLSYSETERVRGMITILSHIWIVGGLVLGISSDIVKYLCTVFSTYTISVTASDDKETCEPRW
jgi:hypothetical protein